MYKALEDIVNVAEREHKEFWEVVLLDDIKERGVTLETGFEQMRNMYHAMKQADEKYDGTLVSESKIVGRDGAKLETARAKGESICGDFIMKVLEKAIKMGESNACMKRIVAAPTAGSCGVLPAVLISMEEEKGFDEETIVKSLIVAAGIGGVIASRAFIAGAAVYLKGGDNNQIIHGAAMALKNLLGLACDPVGGLVEVPCVKRNTIGAVGALTSADMALAGVCSKIKPDEVIDAMRNIGNVMPTCLKETGSGGLAITSCAQKLLGK